MNENVAVHLLPCPFCGSNAHITHKNCASRVECKNRFSDCSMNMRTHHKATDEEAIKAWNTRV